MRILAFYLPQFHPIKENDEWWGKGFTEWTNVGKAKKMFFGHYQPRVPADLGYYDLRVSETREAQAQMAKEYGVEGFCYWHYWFGNGKELLQRPLDEVVASGKPNFPFCLAWANESWKGFKHGLKNRNMLIEQMYPGEEDHIKHFNKILPILKDKRYILVDGKPLFMIYKPTQLPNIEKFIELWNKLAVENGLAGIYFVGHQNSVAEQISKDEEATVKHLKEQGFNAVNFMRSSEIWESRSFFAKTIAILKLKFFGIPRQYLYSKFVKKFVKPIDKNEDVFPTIITGCDHTPRSGREGSVLLNTTPKGFGKHVKDVFNLVKNKNNDKQIVFLKSWNEWAEGNYIEPDLKYGKAFLEALKKNCK